MSLFDLTGKVALVTGSSRGIGRAIVEEMPMQRARVVVSSRNQESCDSVAAAINERYGGGRAGAIAANISSQEALHSLMDGTQRLFGAADILVCNAASNPHYGSLDTLPDEAFLKTFRNNVLATHWLIQLALPAMRQKRDGSIIVVSSIGAAQGSSVIGAYNISKAADLALVRNYAVENGQYNIRVNAIAPGLVRTDFARALWETQSTRDQFVSRAALRRIGEPRDVAGIAVYLASAAGAWTTGQTMTVDGGVTV